MLLSLSIILSNIIFLSLHFNGIFLNDLLRARHNFITNLEFNPRWRCIAKLTRLPSQLPLSNERLTIRNDLQLVKLSSSSLVLPKLRRLVGVLPQVSRTRAYRTAEF